ncbi:hypothetical protein ILUMI_16512 [Ignelater luminosus]|uniref:Uncharacterized protein n=1 Tax=Ignelater luminosus TaxID=2038154 RepID=A0A8K0CR50_IGNLU|nr:hypothetical protein ILUMI_16512 [Ignelater luminosus]
MFFFSFSFSLFGFIIIISPTPLDSVLVFSTLDHINQYLLYILGIHFPFFFVFVISRIFILLFIISLTISSYFPFILRIVFCSCLFVVVFLFVFLISLFTPFSLSLFIFLLMSVFFTCVDILSFPFFYCHFSSGCLFIFELFSLRIFSFLSKFYYLPSIMIFWYFIFVILFLLCFRFFCISRSFFVISLFI